jgi:APA family basic amino acid/polyamine antiporter
MNLFRTKPISFGESGLKRALGPVDLTLMGIGCIVGAGIFVFTGQAAALHAGPAIVLSFAITGIACGFSALCYAELAASIGGCGSAYGYGYASLGEIVGWIIGWDLILEYGLGVASVAAGWSGYVSDALKSVDIHIPYALTHASGVCTSGAAGQCGTVNILAIGIIVVLGILLSVGVKESLRLNAVMVAVKLVALLLFIGLALTSVKPALWQPFIPPVGTNPAGHAAYGFNGIMTGAAVIFFAYIGFDSLSTAAEETRNPQRNVPIGIISAMIVCTILYMVVSLLLTGIVPYRSLTGNSPVSHALLDIGYTWGAAAVAVGAIAGLSTVLLVLFFGITRIIFAISRDGLLPKTLGAVNRKTRTPVRVIVALSIVLSIIAGFVPLESLVKVVNIGTLMAFTVVCVGVIVLRYTKPDMPRPFRVPLAPWLPGLGAVINIYIAAHLPAASWIVFLIWLLIGLCIYFLYSYRHSALHRPRKPAAELNEP